MEVDPVEVAPDGPTEEGAAAQPGEGGAATGDKPQREPSAVSLDIPKARVRKIMKADVSAVAPTSRSRAQPNRAGRCGPVAGRNVGGCQDD